MIHLSMTYCASVFGLGHVPFPLALYDDPPTLRMPREPINRQLVNYERALSSTLSSNQKHRSNPLRQRTYSQLVHHDSAISLIVTRRMSTGTLLSVVEA
jgi:hypothetical protein